MRARPLHTSRRLRSSFVVVLLLLTLGLAGVLAWQAHRAATSHRAVAEDTLRDYAGFAAWRFASVLKGELHWMFSMALHPLGAAAHHGRGAPLPDPASFSVPPEKAAYFPDHMVRAYFRLDLRDGGLEVRGDRASERVRAWMADTVTRNARGVYCPECKLASIFGSPEGEPRVFVYTRTSDGYEGPATAEGFEMDPSTLRPILSRLIADVRYLPPSLMGDVPTDSVLSFVVRDGAGRELYRSPRQYPGDYSASDTVATALGGLRVDVSLRPDMAEELVIGGLPKSRLPLLLGVLLLTAGLVAAALMQHRREYELARLRADFVSNVSHELRTPLAQIRMFAETLLLGRIRSPDEGRRSLEIIDQEARRLTHLVENVLHFSRSERGAVRLAPEPTDVGELVREVVDCFAPLARARQMVLRAELERGLVAPVDRGAVRQMLLNLLDNAMKYGPAGQTVTVHACEAGERVRILVDDQGPGVPPRDRDRVWERFWRLDRAADAAVAGTGIGLSVVRELARLHGGRAWVEAAPRGGARFGLELPRGGEVAESWRRPETLERADSGAAGPAPAASIPVARDLDAAEDDAALSSSWGELPRNEAR
ncbi:MAG: sensor histidine kinase [Gemmatimonadota bacterium]